MARIAAACHIAIKDTPSFYISSDYTAASHYPTQAMLEAEEADHDDHRRYFRSGADCFPVARGVCCSFQNISHDDTREKALYDWRRVLYGQAEEGYTC